MIVEGVTHPFMFLLSDHGSQQMERAFRGANHFRFSELIFLLLTDRS